MYQSAAICVPGWSRCKWVLDEGWSLSLTPQRAPPPGEKPPRKTGWGTLRGEQENDKDVGASQVKTSKYD